MSSDGFGVLSGKGFVPVKGHENARRVDGSDGLGEGCKSRYIGGADRIVRTDSVF